MKLMTLAACVTGMLAMSGAVHAATFTYDTNLLGSNEEPANSSTGFGQARVIVDTDANTLRLQTAFVGLTSASTVAHIHCCTAAPNAGNAGVATQLPTFPGFPSGVTLGAYDQTFDMSVPASYNPAFLAANGDVNASFAALLAGISGGTAYLNVHSSDYPAGEIRGFFASPTAPVPLPPAAWLFGFGIAAITMLSRRPAVY